MAGVLNDALGAPVTFVDGITAAQTTVRAMFREEPIEVAGGDGGFILIEQPTVRVPRTLATGVKRGDKVIVPDGREFRIESAIDSASPANDRFTICTLELIP